MLVSRLTIEGTQNSESDCRWTSTLCGRRTIRRTRFSKRRNGPWEINRDWFWSRASQTDSSSTWSMKETTRSTPTMSTTSCSPTESSFTIRLSYSRSWCSGLPILSTGIQEIISPRVNCTMTLIPEIKSQELCCSGWTTTTTTSRRTRKCFDCWKDSRALWRGTECTVSSHCSTLPALSRQSPDSSPIRGLIRWTFKFL